MNQAAAGSTYFSPEEDAATGKLLTSPPEQTVQQFFDPGQLDRQGRDLATAVNSQGDDFEKDRKLMEEVLDMTGFREITSDMVRACTATMNEMGRLLLRVQLHAGEYEDRFGQEDAERLKNRCRDTFFHDGDMALFLREKRGAGGLRDDEGALAGLLSADLGSSGEVSGSVGGV